GSQKLSHFNRIRRTPNRTRTHVIDINNGRFANGTVEPCLHPVSERLHRQRNAFTKIQTQRTAPLDQRFRNRHILLVRYYSREVTSRLIISPRTQLVPLRRRSHANRDFPITADIHRRHFSKLRSFRSSQTPFRENQKPRTVRLEVEGDTLRLQTAPLPYRRPYAAIKRIPPFRSQTRNAKRCLHTLHAVECIY